MAYAVVTTHRLPEGLPGGAARRWAEIEGTPTLRMQPGFRDYRCAAEDRRLINIVVWDSQADAEVGLRAFEDRLRHSMPGLVALSHTGGELILDSLAGQQPRPSRGCSPGRTGGPGAR